MELTSTGLYICGARGTRPAPGREFADFGGSTTCYVLKSGGSALLCDCGSGLNNAEALLLDCEHVDVLLTHYHYDHIMGLLTNSWLFDKELHFFVPDDAAKSALENLARPPYWPVLPKLSSDMFTAVQPKKVFPLAVGKLSALPANHPGGGALYRVDTEGGSCCFIFDHEHGAKGELADFARSADILIYDGTFSAAEYPSHVGWGHSTPEEGAKLAAAANAGLLLVTHHAANATDSHLEKLEQAQRAAYPALRFAREGECISLAAPHRAERFIKCVAAIPESIDRVLDIGSALSREQDYGKLLDTILEAAMQHTNADAGTIYMAERERLRFHTLKTRSLGVSLTHVSEKNYPPVPMKDEYVCAYCALHGKTVNIENVYENALFNFSGPRAYDKLTGYHTQSMLVLPLCDNEGSTLGVLQLINALDAEGNITGFAEDCIRLVELLSSFSAVALTNMRHTWELKRQMFSFINVIITAVDARTPYNASHTRRIVQMLGALIRYVRENPKACPELGEMTAAREETLLMCAWLHDIGKLVTPLEIMNKSTRLGEGATPLFERLEQITLLSRLAYLEGRCDEKSALAISQRVQRLKEAIALINKPGPLKDEAAAEIRQARSFTYTLAGEERPWLTQQEFDCLMIKTGTLTAEERAVMEQHALMTTRLLQKMDFSKAYDDVKQWAGSHHEKLDGSGYPLGLAAEQLTPEVRLLTILDIYEALTTDERPYKRAMSTEKAFEILHGMADSGQLDGELVRLLEQSRAWEAPPDIEELSFFPQGM